MERRIGVLAIAIVLVLPLLGTPAQGGRSGLLRLSGPSRVETAVEVSRDQFADVNAPSDDRLVAGAVLLARSDAFPDAIAAGPYAVALQAPLLLTQRGSLHSATRAELRRVLPPGGRVVLLGGAAALSEEVAGAVGALGYAVERVAGPTRYATALAIAQATSADPSRVWVADGNTFGDALLAAAAAAAHDGTVVLANGTTLDGDVRAYVERAAEVRAVGPVAATLDMVAPGHRYDGLDTAERGVQMLQDPSLWDLSAIPGIAVASSQDFPDGLAGGAHAGRLGMPLVLADQETMGPAFDVLNAVAPLESAVLYGGTAVLGAGVEAQARTLLGQGFADLAQGVAWQFVRHHTQVSAAQGSSPHRESSTEVFTITLGGPTTIAGQTAYPIAVTGEVATPPVEWTHLAGSLDRLLGSMDGETLVPIYDFSSEWRGGGFFLRTEEVPDSTDYDGSWASGVPALTTSLDASSQECVSLPGEAPICDGDEESTSDFRREWYTPGIGPLGYSATFVLSDCGGGFCTSFTSQTHIDLMTANLDVARDVMVPPTWRFLTAPPNPVVDAFAVALDGAIHLLGGSAGGQVQPIMQVYDPSSDGWSVSGAALPCGSHDEPKAVPHGSGLLLMTVCQGEFSAWQYDAAADTWAELSRLDLDPPPTASQFDALIATADGALLLYGPRDSSRISIGYNVADDMWYGGVEFNRTVGDVHPVGFAGTHMLALVVDPDEVTLEDWDLVTGDVEILDGGFEARLADMVTGHIGDDVVLAAGSDGGDPRWQVQSLLGPTWEDGVFLELPGTIIAGPAAGAALGDELYLFQGDRAEAYRPPAQ